jgi:hypothetical protein
MMMMMKEKEESEIMKIWTIITSTCSKNFNLLTRSVYNI